METVRRLTARASLYQAVSLVAVVIMAFVALRDSNASRAAADKRAADAVAESSCWQRRATDGFGALADGVLTAIDYIVEASQPGGNTGAVDVDGARARLAASKEASARSVQVCSPNGG